MVVHALILKLHVHWAILQRKSKAETPSNNIYPRRKSIPYILGESGYKIKLLQQAPAARTLPTSQGNSFLLLFLIEKRCHIKRNEYKEQASEDDPVALSLRYFFPLV
jgi:hypothetical protein